MRKIITTVFLLGVILLTSNLSYAETNETMSFELAKYSIGLNHSDVSIIQQALKTDGTFKNSKITNYYGKITQQAVKSFQRKYGLNADGVAGHATLAKMYELELLTVTPNTLATLENTVTEIASALESVSRGSGRSQQFGTNITWNKMKQLIVKQSTVLEIEDFETGKKFKVMATYGSNHSDVEPLTKEDTAVIKELWGEYSWKRRPVLVHLNGDVYAASLNGMPHAGLEDKPAGEYVSNRSAGFGYGYNYDFIKGNDFQGHICLHFKNSKLHVKNKQDWQHQKNVRIAAGLE